MSYNLVIKDKNNNLISREHVCSDKHFHIIAREIFYIQIIDYTKTNNSPYIPTLHSVKESSGQIIHNVTDEDTDMLTGNFCYSLYFSENNQEVTIRIIQPSQNYSSMVYKITFTDGNCIDETNSHYQDLITNYFLPSLEELQKSMINSSLYDKRELLKRLLLDFKEITRNKGTKKSVENFFKFLGYDDDTENNDNLDLSNIKLYEEYRKDDGSLTLQPNKTKDIKTGRYHVLYDYYHYLNPIWDEDNLPNVEIVIDDYSEFLDRVMYAIQLANIYFTLDEQEIVFFNTVFASNAPTYQNIQSTTVLTSEYDIMYFRHKLNVNVFVNESSTMKLNKVVDKVQIDKELTSTEIKYVVFKTDDIDFMLHNINFCRANEEIFDDRIIGDENFNNDNYSILNESYSVPNDLNYLYRNFGVILNVELYADPSFELEYKFYLKSLYDPDDNYTYIFKERMRYSENVLDKFVCLKNTSEDDYYVLEVSVYDDTNNKETYFYHFNKNEDNLFIDVDTYNSSFVYDNLTEIEAYRDSDLTDRINELDVFYNEDNNITIDVTAADSSLMQNIITFTYENLQQLTLPNYVLHDEDVPQDLSDYYNHTDYTNVGWLNSYGIYDNNSIEKFYKAFKLKDVTQSLPLKFVEPFIEIISFPVDNRDLKLKVYDPNNINNYRYVDINHQNIIEDNPSNDCICVLKMNILQQPDESSIGQYWVIISTINGVELTKEYFDFWLVDGSNDESVYELEDFKKRQIPVNYDIPLYVDPNNQNIEEVYISDTNDYINIKGSLSDPDDENIYQIKCIKSVYPRLVNRKSKIFKETGELDLYQLKINDIIFCKLDENYNDTHFDTTWEVRDSFDNNILLFTSDTKNLKYRVNRKTCLDIICKTKKHSLVNGEKEIIVFKQSINSSMDYFEI